MWFRAPFERQREASAASEPVGVGGWRFFSHLFRDRERSIQRVAPLKIRTMKHPKDSSHMAKPKPSDGVQREPVVLSLRHVRDILRHEEIIFVERRPWSVTTFYALHYFVGERRVDLDFVIMGGRSVWLARDDTRARNLVLRTDADLIDLLRLAVAPDDDERAAICLSGDAGPLTAADRAEIAAIVRSSSSGAPSPALR